jgi:hypothetical protein
MTDEQGRAIGPDVAIHNGGVTISGEVRDILGDIVGNNKYAFYLNGSQEDAERVMKSVLEIVHETSARLEAAWKKTNKVAREVPSASFWINEVLDPLHSAMEAVHAIYIATFVAVKAKLDADEPASLNSAIDLLSARHFDSRLTRQNLHALRGSIDKLLGRPEEIETYLSACEKYFFEATLTAVRTPMRALLEQLEDINKKGMSEAELETAARKNGMDLKPTAHESVNVVLGHIEQMWPRVLSSYYDGRLGFLRRAEHRDEVAALLKRRKRLARNLTFVPDQERLEAISELEEIDASLEELTS